MLPLNTIYTSINKYINREDVLGEGVWVNEPDFAICIVTGACYQYLCVINRNFHHGGLCGYVVVPYQVPELLSNTITCHGGVTYQSTSIKDFCEGVLYDKEGTNSNRSEELVKAVNTLPHYHGGSQGYVIGFDTAHYGDYNPIMERLMLSMRENLSPMYDSDHRVSNYKSVQFVGIECRGICSQIDHFSKYIGLAAWGEV